jgi:predicted GIY-YIG superfamily endonuclease
MTWFVYLLECVNGKIYTGITTDVQRRFDEHLKATGAKFTRANPPSHIITIKQYDNRSEASKLEYQIKQLKPVQKMALGSTWTITED